MVHVHLPCHFDAVQVMIGEDTLIRFSGCKAGEACTIVLRGARSVFSGVRVPGAFRTPKFSKVGRCDFVTRSKPLCLSAMLHAASGAAE